MQIIKSLLKKNTDFWLEQLVRAGIFEKVEAIANQPVIPVKGGAVARMVIDESVRVPNVSLMENMFLKINEVSEGAVIINLISGWQLHSRSCRKSYKYFNK